MKQEQTPTPWVIDPKINTLIVDKSERHVCSTGGYFDNFSDDSGLAENIANAIFIIKVVNAHDELVEALGRITDAANAITGADIDDPRALDAFDMYQDARLYARKVLGKLK